jgi:acetyl esterase/lipase
MKPCFLVVLLIAASTICPSIVAQPLAQFMTPARPAPEEIVFKRVGEQALKIHLYRPAGGTAGEALPAIVGIHGGAWRAGGADVFFPHAAYFAARGLVGVSIDYRLLTQPIDGVAVSDCLADCKSAIRYLRAHASALGIDPARIAVLGDSAGGHLAAALGTVRGFDDKADDLAISATPNAMILCNPIVDMTEGGWINFIIRGPAFDKKPDPATQVPTPVQLELGRRLSPLYQVRAGQPPTLLMHGLQDRIVTPEQARLFDAAYRASGNRCDLVLLPNASHAFVMTNYRATEPEVVAVIRQIDEFLASLGWVAGPPTLIASEPPAWTKKK